MNVTSITDKITSVEALRKIIKPYPKVLDKRIQPTLDRYSIEFITQASIAALTFGDSSLGMPILDLNDGHLSIDSHSKLSFIASVNSDQKEIKDMPCSLYFLIAGVGHGLRINGQANKIKSIDDDKMRTNIILNIRNVYLHCARAITRAKLWSPQKNTFAPTVEEIIENSPYALLSTLDAIGNTELSPRGDPAGFVTLMNERTLLLPERPGNKVATSLSNIISNPKVSLSLLVPGLSKVLYIEGNACLTADQSLLTPLAIKDKIPQIGIIISILKLSINNCPAIENIGIWKKDNHIHHESLTSFSKALTAHMQGEGLLGKLSNPIISGIVRHDMNNLY